MWYKVAENPEVVTKLYTHVPLLQSVRLTEVTLYQSESRMILKFFTPFFPDRVPKSWEMHQYNTMQIILEFFNIKYFDLLKWIGEVKVDINIEKDTDGVISLFVSSPNCTIRAHAHKLHLTVIGYRFK
jgi:hypothetical protein